MSGGVAPPGDIRLRKEEEKEGAEDQVARGSDGAFKPRRRRLLTLRQLNALAAIVVLSATGLVAYAHFLSRFVFPDRPRPPDPSPVFDERSRALRLYVLLGAALGLFVPAAYIFEGVAEGDKEGVAAAAPHLFLLSGQVFAEGLITSAGAGGSSPPVRVFVPVLYNTRRIFAIVDWLRAEVGKVEGSHGSARRVHAGRWLAAANLFFWGFNLFGFLLPVCLPRAFKRYYGGGATACGRN